MSSARTAAPLILFTSRYWGIWLEIKLALRTKSQLVPWIILARLVAVLPFCIVGWIGIKATDAAAAVNDKQQENYKQLIF